MTEYTKKVQRGRQKKQKLQRGSLREVLKKKFAEKELSLLRRAYEVVGNIAIIEIPEALKKKEKCIAEALLTKKNIDSVLKKGKHQGKLRLQQTRYLAGKRTKETTAIENDVKIKLHVDKVYYSSKQATERKRIYQQVKKRERVLVMFSGAGPFALEIAKHAKPDEVVGIELNKTGHQYAKENAELNKVQVKFLQGDVRTLVPKLGTFSRIIMPLPKQAFRYLDLAFMAAKKNAYIHFYDEVLEKNIPVESSMKIKNAAQQTQRKIRIQRVIKCGQLGIRKYRVCVDVKVVS